MRDMLRPLNRLVGTRLGPARHRAFRARLLPMATALLAGCAAQVPLLADEAPRLAARWPVAVQDGAADRMPLGLPGLAPVLEVALEGNHDVRTALARIEQARASARVAAAGLFPSLTANGAAQRNDLPQRPPTELYSVGGTLAYEVDLWGRNRALAEGGRAALAASWTTTSTNPARSCCRATTAPWPSATSASRR